MTQTHPITPPPELLHDCYDLVQKHLDKGFALQFGISHALRHAYTAGADQELKACVNWLDDTDCEDPQEVAQRLRAARRPKLPSLKEQALNDLDTIQTHDSFGFQIIDLSNIRRALEALDD
jgi:hypothetical protein